MSPTHWAYHTGVDTRAVAEQVRRSDPALLRALGAIAKAPIVIEDSAMLSVMDVRSKARRRAAAGPLDLLLVDYLQLLISDSAACNRVDATSQISRQLKLLTRKLGCPILALSQLSRAVETRPSKIPQLNDLRDSGSLEQDTDFVIFIYREELYDEEYAAQGVAELHIAKQRNGPLGIVPSEPRSEGHTSENNTAIIFRLARGRKKSRHSLSERNTAIVFRKKGGM